MQKLHNYIENINRLFVTGNAREHSYRGDLQDLLNKIIDDKDIVVTNEPARIVNVGAPDYSITKKDIPIGYIEAKDINKPLNSKDYTEQFDRYKNALDNLIITDYMDFWFYKSGELTNKIKIAKIEDNKIVALEENFLLFINNIKSFTTQISQTITSPSKLAKMMAGKARLLQNVIERAIISEDESDANNSLREQLEVFKATLIHDITPESFADIYAQTIAYGMFAARLHDDTMDTFSRQEAVFLIPKSNPFLRGLFNYVSGAECDDRIIWIIDSLAEIFLATDVKKLLDGFSQKSGMNDPIIHFYETFLSEYNPALRKSRGVWYTPQAVVNFIVRACDEVLKDEFDLSDGLSDETKIKIKVDDINSGYTKSGQKIKKELEVHKVQILDPATGTGTFLAETIKFIKKDFWGGSWSSYVEEHLIPRLNGFELLMASYAMAHLKLDLLLLETGYKPSKEQKRFNIFLTNSLEEHHEQSGNLFASYLANESKEADRVKKDVPVMVVMGNPPYAVSSSNKNEWIQNLIADYKKNLNERKINLDDDYIKFIRFSQWKLLEQKNKNLLDDKTDGIMAFITNNSFLSGKSHSKMRESLYKAFDEIYILNLHGNNDEDPANDKNVFDIKSGVCISFFIKNKNLESSKEVNYFSTLESNIFSRESKFELLQKGFNNIQWKKLTISSPNFWFTNKVFNNIEYENFISIDSIFLNFSTAISTNNDNFCIHYSEKELVELYDDCRTLKEDEIRIKYSVKEDSRDWVLSSAIQDFVHNFNPIKISYKPFDFRFTSYSTNGFIAYPRPNTSKHVIRDNLSIYFTKQVILQDNKFTHAFIGESLCDNRFMLSNKNLANIAPLYLFNKNELENTEEKVPNFTMKFKNLISSKEYSNSSPEEILSYIYAILYSPTYRDRYYEYLKIDYPKIPFTDNLDTFLKLSKIGKELIDLHLMKNIPSYEDIFLDFTSNGNSKNCSFIIKNMQSKERYKNQKIFLNDDIYISGVTEAIWNYKIGGYQVLDKWIKGSSKSGSRIDKELTREDFEHLIDICQIIKKTIELENNLRIDFDSFE